MEPSASSITIPFVVINGKTFDESDLKLSILFLKQKYKRWTIFPVI